MPGPGYIAQWVEWQYDEGLRIRYKYKMLFRHLMYLFQPEGASLVEEAYAAYRNGQLREGFFKLEELQKLLKKVPSW